MEENLLNHLQQTELPNNLRLWTNNIPDANRVSLRLMVMVGSGHQSVNRLGLAHFVEHLAFNFNNKSNGAQDVYNAIIQSGGYVNAFTSQDCTSFVADFPSSQLENCIELIRLCMAKPDFSDDMIKTEKGVILDELANYRDTTFWNEIYFNIFGNYAFTYDGVGVESTIKKFKKNDVEQFFAKHYVNNKINLVCVGQFDLEHLKNLIDEKWSEFKTNEEPWSDYEYQAPKLHHVKVSNYDLSHSIYYGYRVCGVINYSKDYLALWFIRDYLQEILFEYVREKGYLYGINIIYQPSRHTGMFLISVPFIKKGRRKLIKKIKKEISNLVAGLIEDKKFEEARKTLVNQYSAFLGDYRRLAEEYELHITSHAKDTEFTDVIGEVMKLNSTDIVDVAKKYFSKVNHFTIKNYFTTTAWGWFCLIAFVIGLTAFMVKYLSKLPGLYIKYSPIICVFLLLIVVWLLLDRKRLSRLN